MVKQLIATLIEHDKGGLVRTFNAVPDDKLTWKPMDNGRHALDLFSEAAQTAGLTARLLESKGQDQPTREEFGRMREERADWTKPHALEAMEANTQRLMAALDAATEAELAVPVTMQWADGMTMPLAGWTMISYRMFVARFAQINYIQTLYGDFEGH